MDSNPGPHSGRLFLNVMLHLSHVKQLYSQPLHLTHELIKLCIQITRGIQILTGAVFAALKASCKKNVFQNEKLIKNVFFKSF